MSHEPFETLAAVYAVGALDGDDLAQFEAHLPSCAVCQAALREAEDALARAMLSTPPQAPPAEARQALVRRVGRAGGADRRSWLTWAVATTVVAAAAAGFTGTWVAVRYEARLGQMARETAAVKGRLARNEASLRDQLFYRGAVELLEFDEELSKVFCPNANTVVLNIQMQRTVARAGQNSHCSAVVAELHSIREQVKEHLPEPVS